MVGLEMLLQSGNDSLQQRKCPGDLAGICQGVTHSVPELSELFFLFLAPGVHFRRVLASRTQNVHKSTKSQHIEIFGSLIFLFGEVC